MEASRHRRFTSASSSVAARSAADAADRAAVPASSAVSAPASRCSASPRARVASSAWARSVSASCAASVSRSARTDDSRVWIRSRSRRSVSTETRAWIGGSGVRGSSGSSWLTGPAAARFSRQTAAASSIPASRCVKISSSLATDDSSPSMRAMRSAAWVIRASASSIASSSSASSPEISSSRARRGFSADTDLDRSRSTTASSRRTSSARESAVSVVRISAGPTSTPSGVTNDALGCSTCLAAASSSVSAR